ncbi:MAG TPA: hypothetical protein VHL12_05420 [Gemmatimonadaceae bacterium]|nr:hypothetical protein [Gemmatimonadaceae bacterium]
MEPPERSTHEPVVAVARRIFSARDKEVAPYARLYPLLLAEMGAIMADWDRHTDELPWSDLEKTERQNNLAGVITRVIDCAMSGASREDRVNALIEAACVHGTFRRRQGVDVASLFLEYDKIRAATWRQVKQLAENPTSYDAIFVIDGLLSIATRGTILGYHRKEMEANGLWAKHMDELKASVRS